MLDWTNAVKALFLGLIEGMTEFLPVSSTGHLILVSDWINFSSDEGRVFEVVVQLGAILAVCWLFRQRLITLAAGVLRKDPVSWRFSAAVLLAFLPAAFLGALFIDTIKAVLFNPVVVASALIAGGLVILWVENRVQAPQVVEAEEIGWLQAFGIGLAQCVAMIPGVSRSGATIIGGMLSGVSRQAATEFSFFLAMPTMLGASVYDAWRHQDLLRIEDLGTIALGFAAAFLSALLVVEALVRFVARHTLRVFAWYRIGLGLLVAAGFWFGRL